MLPLHGKGVVTPVGFDLVTKVKLQLVFAKISAHREVIPVVQIKIELGMSIVKVVIRYLVHKLLQQFHISSAEGAHV